MMQEKQRVDTSLSHSRVAQVHHGDPDDSPLAIRTVMNPTGAAKFMLPLRQSSVINPNRVQRRLQPVRTAWIVRSIDWALSQPLRDPSHDLRLPRLGVLPLPFRGRRRGEEPPWTRACRIHGQPWSSAPRGSGSSASKRLRVSWSAHASAVTIQSSISSRAGSSDVPELAISNASASSSANAR